MVKSVSNYIRKQRLLCLMENQTRNKVYFHYNHTDSCKFARWTARESFEFMYGRPWQPVLDFYSNLVNRRVSLLNLFGTQTDFFLGDSKLPEDSDRTELESVTTEYRSGKWARITYKIVLSYHGGSFEGWQKQPGLNTVQGLMEMSLGRFVDENKAQLLKNKCKPLEGCAFVAGRTDKGVSALQQVCSFYTWKTDVKPHEIEDAINNVAPGNLRAISVSKVSRAFHPNFSAKWRRYFYIFPINDGEDVEQNSESVNNLKTYSSNEYYSEKGNGCGGEIDEENVQNLTKSDEDDLEVGKKPRSFSVCRVNQLLIQLEGKLLSYKIFARDTKASRNIGPPTECFVYHARATEARLPCLTGEGTKKVMCVELVANRFLRKMVRVIVATSIREAAAGAEADALLKLMDATCRRATAPPAPPDGLCLVDVGYNEFDPKNCLIS
ncbi:PseudoU_synth_1 domain-containing protein [Cephalotus follicularis]|uniref:tRNA pseudouridine synthase n=1 Tax=Cephalotus follicularis TaxID=3775 RepID=A0A1Q3AW01_CEPFO|nr:PseudoU_synth_1 domain-containing protein [Cephalotus follicularis]